MFLTVDEEDFAAQCAVLYRFRSLWHGMEGFVGEQDLSAMQQAWWRRQPRKILRVHIWDLNHPYTRPGGVVRLSKDYQVDNVGQPEVPVRERHRRKPLSGPYLDIRAYALHWWTNPLSNDPEKASETKLFWVYK